MIKPNRVRGDLLSRVWRFTQPADRTVSLEFCRDTAIRPQQPQTEKSQAAGPSSNEVVLGKKRAKKGIVLADKNTVLRSFNLDGETRCVDIFRRPDGSYGFEEYRRDPEDGRGWFAVGSYAARTYASEGEALAAAKVSVSWLTSVLEDR